MDLQRRFMMGKKAIWVLALLWGFIFVGMPVWAFQLPDTGQTTCYDAGSVITCPSSGQPFYGQDAQYAGPQPSYHDNDYGTVTDLKTGLMWQKYDAGSATWLGACDYCNSLTLPSGGHSDWRLPNRRELMSIVLYGQYDQAIDPVFSCHSSRYWPSTTVVGDSRYAWVVHFGSGYVTYTYRTSGYCVRCVRGGL
jgi:hypothetical protein